MSRGRRLEGIVSKMPIWMEINLVSPLNILKMWIHAITKPLFGKKASELLLFSYSLKIGNQWFKRVCLLNLVTECFKEENPFKN